MHVQGHNDTQVHVDKLGGKVEVSLKIRGVHYIHHDVRNVFDKILPYIEFLRAVCGKRICARKVDDLKMIASVLEVALLCIDGHAAVVAHMLMTSRSHVEKRCLTAVRVTYQGDTDHPATFLDQGIHLLFHPRFSLSLQCRQGFTLGKDLLCLCL